MGAASNRQGEERTQSQCQALDDLHVHLLPAGTCELSLAHHLLKPLSPQMGDGVVTMPSPLIGRQVRRTDYDVQRRRSLLFAVAMRMSPAVATRKSPLLA